MIIGITATESRDMKEVQHKNQTYKNGSIVTSMKMMLVLTSGKMLIPCV